MDVTKLLEKASDHLTVRRAFGAAYEKDGVLIIPVALVAGGGGGGTAHPRRATSPGTVSESAVPERADPAQQDSGGGFGGLIMPVGVYVVKGDQVRWVSAVDVTLAVLGGLSLARVLTRSLTGRPRRRT